MEVATGSERKEWRKEDQGRDPGTENERSHGREIDATMITIRIMIGVLQSFAGTKLIPHLSTLSPLLAHLGVSQPKGAGTKRITLLKKLRQRLGLGWRSAFPGRLTPLNRKFLNRSTLEKAAWGVSTLPT